MSIQVYVNDGLLELKPNAGIGLTFQVGSILTPNGRAGNLSNKFSVPKTKNNTAVLGNLSNINSNTTIPYDRNSGKIVIDGIELFSDGFALVDSTGVDYSVTVYSGNVSFFDLIRGRNVNQIDWAASNHDYTITNILASFTSTSLDYTYPIIDWGSGFAMLDNTTLQNADALIACAYLKPVLEKIASEIGYELKGTFKDKQQYDRLILAPNAFAYTNTEVETNTGSLTDVDAIGVTEETIDSNLSASGATEYIDIPLVYNTITGALFTPNQYIPDNYYFGTLTANVQGINNVYIPERGEESIQTGTTYRQFKNAHTNETHAVYINNRTGFTEQLVWLRDIKLQTITLIATLGVGGTQSLSSISEGTDGFIAYSHVISGNTNVYLYDIALGTTTTIYNNVGGSGIVDYLKIRGGRVVWSDSQVGGGLFIYDIATSTTKTIRTFAAGAIGAELDHDGEYVVYEEPTGNDVVIYDYTTATNTVIKNQGAFSGIDTVHVLGDYATFFDGINDVMESYKISTSSLVTALSIVGASASARSTTKLSFSSSSTGEVYYYDLLTDTLTNTGEADSAASNDFKISMSSNYISYIAGTNNKVKTYNISTTTISTIETVATNQITKLIITSTDVVVYHYGGTADVIRMYDITASAFWTNIINTNTVTYFEKAFNNSRIIFTNDSGLSSSVKDRVSFINPIITPLEVVLNLVIKEDGVIVYSETETFTSQTINNQYNYLIDTGIVYVKSGSVYSIEFFEVSDRDNDIDYWTNYTLSDSSLSFTPTKRIPYKANINFANIFDAQQVDVFKDVMNMYGLIIQTNDLTKQVFLNPLNDLTSNLANAVDWSSKINLARVPVVKYKVGGYAQTNYFKYAEDDDVPADTGIGSFDLTDFNLEPEKDILVLKSAASVSELRVDNEHTPTIPFKTFFYNWFDQKKSRILLLDKISKTVDWQNTIDSDTGQSATLPLCYFNKAGKIDNLDFTSLLLANYPVLMGMLNQVKFVSAGFLLNAVDISNLDFTIPVYLDVHNSEIHINGYFYINKISNFKAENTTTVDLIRL